MVKTFDLYRAVWRWHFYAGLLVLPFMITLSITGALYLFSDELDAIIHADLKRVVVEETTQSPSTLINAALDTHPGTAINYTDPATPDSSVDITVNTLDDKRLAVYVDPYSANGVGSLDDRGTVMWTVRYLHSFKYFGPTARKVIEIAAGWSILLVGTGIYLWWPRRKGSGGVVSVRGKPKSRVFWHDLHAVLGAFAGAFIIFLAFTGMPWSGVWGG
ncbi:MAG TPA: PepSY domain-containing protein, partial [Halomonas sp.]|nr:PepSY domain-containing protein [Halomonas sp.]